jgi:hypothetical protein
MWDTLACATANLLTHFIISIAVLENKSPDAGLQKRATFSTLNVGLAGTGKVLRISTSLFRWEKFTADGFSQMVINPPQCMLDAASDPGISTMHVYVEDYLLARP